MLHIFAMIFMRLLDMFRSDAPTQGGGKSP
jgi:hypothetical protein